jgi:gluconate kinase
VTSSYLVTGVSGSGKTAVARELIRRGFAAVDADEAIAAWVDPAGREVARPGSPGDGGHEWEWSPRLLSELLDADRDGPLFVCGNANNQRDFYHRFDAVFLLRVDAATMLRRIDDPARDNDFGRSPDQRRLLLEWLPGFDAGLVAAGAVVIDAAAPLAEVVDVITTYAGARAGRS